MPKFIDREALIRNLEKALPEYRKALIVINGYIRKQPAVKIIRCKNCSFYDAKGNNKGVCIANNNIHVEDDAFCSYGELSFEAYCGKNKGE